MKIQLLSCKHTGEHSLWGRELVWDPCKLLFPTESLNIQHQGISICSWTLCPSATIAVPWSLALSVSVVCSRVKRDHSAAISAERQLLSSLAVTVPGPCLNRKWVTHELSQDHEILSSLNLSSKFSPVPIYCTGILSTSPRVPALSDPPVSFLCVVSQMWQRDAAPWAPISKWGGLAWCGKRMESLPPNTCPVLLHGHLGCLSVSSRIGQFATEHFRINWPTPDCSNALCFVRLQFDSYWQDAQTALQQGWQEQRQVIILAYGWADPVWPQLCNLICIHSHWKLENFLKMLPPEWILYYHGVLWKGLVGKNKNLWNVTLVFTGQVRICLWMQVTLILALRLQHRQCSHKAFTELQFNRVVCRCGPLIYSLEGCITGLIYFNKSKYHL